MRPASTKRTDVVARALEAAEDHERRGHADTAALLLEQVHDAVPGDACAAGTSPGDPHRSLARRAVKRAAREALQAATHRPRIWKYRLLSTCPRVTGRPVVLQPVLFVGPGSVRLGEDVQFGWPNSPLFHAGYCYVEVSRPESAFEVGERTEFNNNLMVKSEGAGIRVGRDGLFGAGIEIFDSNFHDLHPARRRTGAPRLAPVEIGDNVFVGMGVRILKGVTIGSDTVVGAGAVVTSSLPAGVIAGGNPARVIREL